MLHPLRLGSENMGRFGNRTCGRAGDHSWGGAWSQGVFGDVGSSSAPQPGLMFGIC